MTVHDAEVGDIYVDKQGKLWRCLTTCHEPTVTFEAVEGYVPDNNPPRNATFQEQANWTPLPSPTIVKPQQRGGISGLMWEGWKRVHRPELVAK